METELEGFFRTLSETMGPGTHNPIPATTIQKQPRLFPYGTLEQRRFVNDCGLYVPQALKEGEDAQYDFYKEFLRKFVERWPQELHKGGEDADKLNQDRS